jgi:hypothetical protein
MWLAHRSAKANTRHARGRWLSHHLRVRNVAGAPLDGGQATERIRVTKTDPSTQNANPTT